MEKDSGWSWIVSVGAFVGMFLETGMIKCFGVLLPELREHFSAETWVIGLAISLLPGFGAVTCIIASGLKTYSSRFIIMLFGVISSIGLLLCSISITVPVLATGLTLSGFAFGAEALTHSVLPVYFDKYYDISNSIAHVGLSLGVMIMPPLTQLLIDTYGWRGTLLILTALNMHIILGGTLLRPLQSIDLTKSAENLTPSEYPDNIDSKQNKRKERLRFFETFIHTFDLDLLKNSECITLLVGSIGYGYYYVGWLIYLVPHAEDVGFSPYAASALATAGGVGNLAGSCAFPFVANILSSTSMLIVSHFIAFLSLAADPILSIGPVYIGLILAAFGLNFAFAIFGCAISKRIVEIVHESRVRSLFNLYYGAYGIGSVFSGFISGWLFDQYGNFTVSFLVLSIAPLLSVIPMIIQSYTNLSKDRKYHAINTLESR